MKNATRLEHNTIRQNGLCDTHFMIGIVDVHIFIQVVLIIMKQIKVCDKSNYVLYNLLRSHDDNIIKKLAMFLQQSFNIRQSTFPLL